MLLNLPFSATGLHKPTMTTADDPALKVFNCDNGTQWLLTFYVNNKLIDVIDLEKLVDSERPWKIVNSIHPSLFDVTVFDEKRTFTLREFLKNVLSDSLV
jgi:hypothetical protein